MKRPAAAALLIASVGACSYTPTRAPKSMAELRAERTVLQTHEYSCGAAALATLMGRFGKQLGEAEVLASIFRGALPLEPGADGRPRLRALTLADLEAGARANGFKVVSTRVPDRRSFAPVMEALGPGIARMRLYKEYPHFVLLDELRDGWVRVSDPAYGSYWLPSEQLFASWDSGERLFLTISPRPFQAWKAADDQTVYLKRGDRDAPPPASDPGPAALSAAASRRLAVLSALSR